MDTPTWFKSLFALKGMVRSLAFTYSWLGYFRADELLAATVRRVHNRRASRDLRKSINLHSEKSGARDTAYTMESRLKTRCPYYQLDSFSTESHCLSTIWLALKRFNNLICCSSKDKTNSTTRLLLLPES